MADEKEIIANNLRKLIKEHQITQKDLANKVGITPATLSDYLNLRSKPSHGVLQKLADYFEVGKSDIDTTFKDQGTKQQRLITIYNQLHPQRQKKVYNYASNQLEEQNSNVSDLAQKRAKRQHEFPWCGAASAGTGEFLMEDQQEMVLIDEDMIPADADFCLTVNGDSMEPIFPDQSYIFIKKQCDLRSGEIGVVIVDDEAFIKRVWYDDDHARLESFNKKYPDRIVDRSANFKVVGKVVL